MLYNLNNGTFQQVRSNTGVVRPLDIAVLRKE